MVNVNLNSTWKYRVGHGVWEDVTVPFSRLPVGHSECYRIFDSEQTADKVFLKFDGITYALYGKASGENRDDSMLRSKYAEPGTETFAELVLADLKQTR